VLVAEKKPSQASTPSLPRPPISRPNRWITEVDWDAAALSHQRLAWLQRDPQTLRRPAE
jgi:hypothetical protein